MCLCKLWHSVAKQPELFVFAGCGEARVQELWHCLGAGGKGGLHGVRQEGREVLAQFLRNGAQHAVGILPQLAVLYLETLSYAFCHCSVAFAAIQLHRENI